MNNHDLHKYADQFLRENFELKLEIPIRVSKRMKSKLGAFQVKLQNKKVVAKEIVMSESFLNNNSADTILDVLYHECVHYALYMLKKPYKDSDCEFNETLEHLGIAKTRTYKYKGQAHLYKCKKCSYQFTKKIKGYDKRYICKHCRGKFTYKGMVDS